jgi:hypothetical protein
MCPACLAALAVIVAGTRSTGGVAAVLIHKFHVQKGLKKMGGVSGGEWTETKQKDS